MTVSASTSTSPRSLSPDLCINLVRDLVAVSSISRNERAAVEFFTRGMNSLGLSASIDEAGNAIGVRGASNPTYDIVLLGHIDTVPGNIPVRIEDGILHGRGAVDAKGPLAAFALAAAQATLPPGVRLVVIGAVEEEVATSRGARFAATQFQPAACFIGEPSGVSGVTLGYKGRLLAHVVANCEGSHSAGPAPTATELATDWWFAARELAKSHNASRERVFDQIQPRMKDVHATIDGDSETATANFSFRLPIDVSPEAFAEELRTLPQSSSLQITFTGHERAHQSGRMDPVARALSHAIRAHGMLPSPKLKTGTSDMNVVAPIWKCPIAAYGAGDSSLDHTPREHLILAEFLQSVSVLTSAIETLAGELTSVTL